jgi:hypothetical protein
MAGRQKKEEVEHKKQFQLKPFLVNANFMRLQGVERQKETFNLAFGVFKSWIWGVI